MAPPGTLLVTSWYVCLVLAAPLIVFRLRSRLKRHEKLGVDDVVFIAAIFVVLGFNATMTYVWNQGLADWKAGYHVPRAQVVEIMQMLLPSKLLYISAAWMIKFSVALLYRIIAPPGSRAIIMCYVLLGSLVISWSATFFYTLFGCLPWDKHWAGDLKFECPAGFIVLSWWLLTGFNFSTNIVIVLFPITMVPKLDSRLRDKIAIILMFVFGFAAIAASAMQAYYNFQNDTMYAATASMAELSAGLIGASLFALSKNVFQAATPSRSHSLASSHRQAHHTDMKMLEAYGNEEDANAKHSLFVRNSLSARHALSAKRPMSTKRSLSVKRSTSIKRVNNKDTNVSRMSTASNDSLVLPGHFHIGWMMEDMDEINEVPDEKGIGRITVCADMNDLMQCRRSQLVEEIKSPSVESWYER